MKRYYPDWTVPEDSIPKCVYADTDAGRVPADLVAGWDVYDGETGNVSAKVVKYLLPDGSKTIRRYHASDTGWKMGGSSRNDLYGLHSLIHGVVFLTEGEQAAAALHRLGLEAVTPGSASSFENGPWTKLPPVRRFICWPDKDPAGEEAMRIAGRHLARLPSKPEIIALDAETLRMPDGLPNPPKGDAADFVDTLADMAGLSHWDGATAWPDKPEVAAAELWRLIKPHLQAWEPEAAHVEEVERPGRYESMWPKPLAEAAFHGLAGKLVRTIEPHSEADPAAILMNFLTAFGSAAGASPHFCVEGGRHHARLFVALVGETSKGRKGTSWSRVRQLMGIADPMWMENCTASGLSSGEGLIWRVRDPIYKQEKAKGKTGAGCQEVCVDEGVADKRLLVIEPELASTLNVMARPGNTLSPLIRDSWDTGDLQSLTKNAPATVTGAHISILGHITKDELGRTMEQTEAFNGFGNRFLWVCTCRSKCLPEGGSLYDDDLEPLSTQITDMLTFARNCSEVRRDAEARTLWHEVYPALSEGLPGLLGAVTGRAEAQVMRLAMLYALLDGNTMINIRHLRAALEVWRYCFDSAKYIFGEALGDPVADTILESVMTAPKTRTEIRDIFGRHKGAEAIARALEMLMRLGRIKVEHLNTGGRPVEVFSLV